MSTPLFPERSPEPREIISLTGGCPSARELANKAADSGTLEEIVEKGTNPNLQLPIMDRLTISGMPETLKSSIASFSDVTFHNSDGRERLDHASRLLMPLYKYSMSEHRISDPDETPINPDSENPQILTLLGSLTTFTNSNERVLRENAEKNIQAGPPRTLARAIVSRACGVPLLFAQPTETEPNKNTHSSSDNLVSLARKSQKIRDTTDFIRTYIPNIRDEDFFKKDHEGRVLPDIYQPALAGLALSIEAHRSAKPDYPLGERPEDPPRDTDRLLGETMPTYKEMCTLEDDALGKYNLPKEIERLQNLVIRCAFDGEYDRRELKRIGREGLIGAVDAAALYTPTFLHASSTVK